MLPIPMTRLFTRGAFDQLEVHFAIKIAFREIKVKAAIISSRPSVSVICLYMDAETCSMSYGWKVFLF